MQKTPQHIFSLDADLLFPPKYIAKVLVVEQQEKIRQKKQNEYYRRQQQHQRWADGWKQTRFVTEQPQHYYHRQEEEEEEEEKLPWYKTFFRQEADDTGAIYDIDEAETNNMGTTALDYDKLWAEAKTAFSKREKPQSPNYMPLPVSSTYDYSNSNYNPSAPPLLKDQIDVYGGMSQTLKNSCLPLTSRKQPRSFHNNNNNIKGFGRGWIKKKRQKKPSHSYGHHDHQLAPRDLELGIPFPGSGHNNSSSSIHKPSHPNSGLRRRRQKKYRGRTYK